MADNTATHLRGKIKQKQAPAFVGKREKLLFLSIQALEIWFTTHLHQSISAGKKNND